MILMVIDVRSTVPCVSFDTRKNWVIVVDHLDPLNITFPHFRSSQNDDFQSNVSKFRRLLHSRRHAKQDSKIVERDDPQKNKTQLTMNKMVSHVASNDRIISDRKVEGEIL